jgi:hypothetical protein
MAQGQYREAELLLKLLSTAKNKLLCMSIIQVAEVRKMHLGDDHLDTLKSMNELAYI